MQNYISRVHLKGYKSIRDVSIDLLPGLNIIIGANGSGKTNFLEFVEALQDSVYYAQFASEPFSAEVYVNDKKIKEIVGIFQLHEGEHTFEFKSKNFSNSKLTKESQIFYDINRKISKSSPGNYVNGIIDYYTNVRGKFDTPDDIAFIRFGSKYNLDNGFEFKIFRDANKKILSSGITNIPYEFFQMLLSESIKVIGEDSFDKNSFAIDNVSLIENLRNYTPIQDLTLDYDSIFIQPIGASNWNVKNVQLKFLVNDKWLYWHQLSDGTKRIFYIISTLLEGDSQYFFIEEPELGIHPDQLFKLMNFLEECSQEKQIIISTHSPEVLRIVSIEELDRIVVARYDTENGTMMRKLTREQAYQMGETFKDGDLFLSERWVHLRLEDDIFNAQTNEIAQ
jgi:predicted ATP-dependent endonuclease of OLD family